MECHPVFRGLFALTSAHVQAVEDSRAIRRGERDAGCASRMGVTGNVESGNLLVGQKRAAGPDSW